MIDLRATLGNFRNYGKWDKQLKKKGMLTLAGCKTQTVGRSEF